jgi:hypothetical protein
MGLSLIHTHRTVRKLQQDKLIEWRAGQQRLRVPDLKRLAAVARIRWPLEPAPRPLI